MAINDYLRNIRLGPPPLATPITDSSSDQFGLPKQFRSNDAPVRGNLDPSWLSWFKGAGQRLLDLPSVQDTAANRVLYKADRYLGMFYRETDTGVFYISGLVSSIPTWIFAFGLWYGLQANLPATLGTADAGFEAEVSDYGHRLRWSGMAWTWAPGDGGSGFIQLFEVDPTGAGWHLVDGTANVKYLKADGTTGTVTLPDLTTAGANAAFMVGGTPNSGPNAATAPTVGAGTLATGAAATGITLPTNTGGPSGTTVVQAGAGSTVASSIHTHTEGSITDPTHTHSLTGSVTVGADGTPRNLVRRPWFRQ